jgi:DNA-binding beta-propeller fold protein YncE
MRVSHFCRSAFGICAAVAMLAGCSGSQSAISPMATVQNVRTHADRGRSWMAPGAKSGGLLYVSDQGGARGKMDVYVFSYPHGTLVGTLTGFDEPSGECSDKAGNVFIVNAFGQDILEYAHGGTSPIHTFDDANEYPSGCSVDPTTGNLAVTNYCEGTISCAGPGSVSFFASGKKPKQYGDSKISNFLFCGYDNNGNLFLDGTKARAFGFAEFRAGASKITNITLNQRIGYPGNVQWDGTYVAVGDSRTNTIYRFTITGTKGTEAGSTPLNGASSIGQFWIQGTKVVGPNYLGSKVGNVMFWKYPTGGSSIKTITGLSVPEGATVSL